MILCFRGSFFISPYISIYFWPWALAFIQRFEASSSPMIQDLKTWSFLQIYTFIVSTLNCTLFSQGSGSSVVPYLWLSGVCAQFLWLETPCEGLEPSGMQATVWPLHQRQDVAIGPSGSALSVWSWELWLGTPGCTSSSVLSQGVGHMPGDSTVRAMGGACTDHSSASVRLGSIAHTGKRLCLCWWQGVG